MDAADLARKFATGRTGVRHERTISIILAGKAAAAEFDERGLIPDSLAKLLAGHQNARLRDENLEDAQRLRLDSYGTAVAEQRPRIEIEPELGKPKAPASRLGPHIAGAQ
jgi:hypothetical protein